MDIVARGVEALRGLHAGQVDLHHDVPEAVVHRVAGPLRHGRVLRHLQPRNRDAAGVRRLARAEQDPGLGEPLDRGRLRRHVRALADDETPVRQEIPRVPVGDLVLRRRRERALRGNRPERVLRLRRVRRGERGRGIPLGILPDAPPPLVLQVADERQLLRVDTVRVVDEPAGVGEGHRFRLQLDQLLHRELRHIAAAGNQTGLPGQTVAPGGQHLGGEVHRAVAGGLRADPGAAPTQPLPGEHPGELVGDALVLAEQETDLPAADADVAGGHIGLRAEVPGQLGHERLAEPHDLAVALSLRVEVRPALAAAERQGGQGVLEHLLEGQELQDPQVHRRVEAEPALVGAERAVHLHPEPPVHFDPAVVVHPRHPEQEHPLRLDDAFQDADRPVLRVPVEHHGDGFGDLAHRLVELRLRRIPGDDIGHQGFGVTHC